MGGFDQQQAEENALPSHLGQGCTWHQILRRDCNASHGKKGGMSSNQRLLRSRSEKEEGSPRPEDSGPGSCSRCSRNARPEVITDNEARFLNVGCLASQCAIKYWLSSGYLSLVCTWRI